jgi:hypothetical protein
MNDFKKMADEKRRDFLKFVAKAGISIPALQASTLAMGIMSSRFAEAQTSSAKIQRVVFVYIPGGTPFVTPPGGNADTPKVSTFTPSGSAGALTMNSCSQAFDEVKQNCIFFKDTMIVAGESEAGGHGLTFRVLGAFNGNGTTVDNVLAQSAIGSTSRFSSLRLGVISNTTAGATLDCSISSTNIWTQSTYSSNPRTVFNTLFTGGTGGGGGTVTTAQLQQTKIYDMNLAALQKIRNQLSTTERLRADENIAAIEKLKTDLNSSNDPISSGCSNPSWNNYGSTDADPMEGQHFSQLFDQQARNAALALACNLTKVVSIQMGTDGSNITGTGFANTLHDSIHSGSDAKFIAHRAYLSGRVRSLIDILKSTTDEAGRPLFESTLIVQLSDMGNGSDHSGKNAPLMLASGNAKFNGGRIITANTHTQLLDTAAQSIGLTGYTPYSAGAVAGVFS